MGVVASKVLYNLVYDPAFLVVAWRRVRGNRGARTAGVDGVAPRSLPPAAEKLLAGLRDDLKARRFVAQRVRQKTIPKRSAMSARWVSQPPLTGLCRLR